MKSIGSNTIIRLLGKTASLRIFLAFAVAIFFLSNIPVQAAYLKNVPQTLTQPDGSILKCFATGDERYTWLHDINNFTIVQDAVTGFYVYAKKSGSSLIATSVVAGKTNPASAGLTPGQNLASEQVITLSRDRLRIPALKGSSTAATTGTLNNIVIFIRFNDQDEYTEPIAKYSNAFNATGTASMVEYFKEVSGSQLTINTSLFPQTGGSTVVSYKNSMDRKYYCKYNAATNPTGYQNDTERSDREMALLKAATESVKSQIESTGLDYDSDNNGMIDNVCFIVKGDTDGWGGMLWPHMWAMVSGNVTIGGARVWDFNFQVSDVFGVHMLCHEMSHTLGFPDLYRYVDNSITPVNSWDVMASTTNPPQQPSVYTKVKYGKWASSIPVISTGGTYTLNPSSTDAFAAYKIASPSSTSEYFVVEYRKTSGLFDAQLLGSGLIIYRVTPSLNGNSYGPPDEVYVCRPNGTLTEDGDLDNAYFSSGAGRTSFGGSSATQCFLSNGAPGGFQINNIGAAGDNISFTVSFGDAPSTLAVTPTSRDMASGGGSTTFAVSNTGGGTMTWTAAVTSGTWAHITSGSTGSNTGTITLTADANTGSTSRTATITLTAPNTTGAPKTITIVQAANPAALDITPATRNLDHNGGVVTFAVTNTGGGAMRWNAALTAGTSWAQITSGTDGTNSGTIQLTVDPNKERTPRTATITVTATDAAGSPKTLTVYQAANNTMLSVGPEVQNVNYGNTTTTFSVSNTGGGTMIWSAAVTTGSDWAHITSGSDGSNSGTIQVSVSANQEITPRTAVITITAADATGSPATLNIIQAANETILIAGPDSQPVSFEASTTTFAVNNAGVGVINWTATVSSGSSWAHILSGADGSNAGTIQVSLDINPDNAPRTALITVTDASGKNSPKTLVVNQDPNIPVLNVTPDIRTLDFSNGTVSFSVSNTGGGQMNWTAAVTEGNSWARISSGSTGTNNGVITLDIETNSGAVRAAEITITAQGTTGGPVTVSITQTAPEAELEVDPDIQTIDYHGGQVSFGISKTGFGTINWEAQVTDAPAWVHITAGTSGVNEGQITAEIDINNGTRRTAYITVTSNDPEVPVKILTINQDISNGVNINTFDNKLHVYPNPVDHQCTVQIEDFNGNPARLDVINMMGQLEYSRSLTQEQTVIDASSLSKGIYLFRVTSENNVLSQQRMVKN